VTAAERRCGIASSTFDRIAVMTGADLPSAIESDCGDGLLCTCSEDLASKARSHNIVWVEKSQQPAEARHLHATSMFCAKSWSNVLQHAAVGADADLHRTCQRLILAP
jgi:hypothetical protein